MIIAISPSFRSVSLVSAIQDANGHIVLFWREIPLLHWVFSSRKPSAFLILNYCPAKRQYSSCNCLFTFLSNELPLCTLVILCLRIHCCVADQLSHF